MTTYRERHRVYCEVPAAEVAFYIAMKAGYVHMQPGGQHGAVDAPLRIQGERRTPEPRRYRPCERLRVGIGCDVHVIGRPTQEQVPDDAADEEGLRARGDEGGD